MPEFSLQAQGALLVTLAVFAALQWRRGAPSDIVFLGGLVAVTLLGIISPSDALSGFANPAVLMIGALFVVAAGMRTTGVLDWIGSRLLGTAKTSTAALVRLAFTVVGISAFINNTPVVAMFVPVVLDWCRRRGKSPSKILIPLSYMAIMGGTCSLIGTSTNLVVNAQLSNERQDRSAIAQGADGAMSPRFEDALRDMTLFEIGQVGVPCALVGVTYLLLLGRRFLPDRSNLIERLGEQRREYLLEMLVQPECRLIGKTVEEAGLRHLRGLFLIEIDRADDVITPVTPGDVIHAGDRLIFTGLVTTIVDLTKIQGLVPAVDLTYEINPKQRRQRHLTEAVISSTSPLISQTVRQANFRRLYNAAVVAVHRNGLRLSSKVGDIRLQAGDTLLLQTRTEFASRHRNHPDFFLVASVEGSEPRRHDRAKLAIGLVLILIAWLTASSWIDPAGPWAGLGSKAIAAIAIAGVMVVLRCLPISEARSAVDLQVLITIAAALGLGRALTESGAAEGLAQLLVQTVGAVHPFFLLIVVYVIAMVFTEMITNVAVAAMLCPLAVATASQASLSPRPFVMAIALAASLSFITPIGYQTNLMVMGPGGYQPRDYLRVGLPLALLVSTTALCLIPLVWPFSL